MIRRSVIAGSWYPGQKDQLEKMLSGFFDKARVPNENSAHAIIAPHAGYLYSGQIAAHSFKSLKKDGIKRAVVVAPSHSGLFQGMITSAFEGYETPLGTVKVDSEAVEILRSEYFIKSQEKAESKEHALEIMIPFLQHSLKEFTIIPVLVGGLKDAHFPEGARMLSRFDDGKTVFVFSSDFMHFGYQFGYVPFETGIAENIKKSDGVAIDKILQLDFDGFIDYVETTGTTICGYQPIGLLIKYLKNLGGGIVPKGTLLQYAMSGSMTGDFDHSVSYAAISFEYRP